MAKKEDLVYVNIENPADVRRALLEASKSLVHILKGQHSIRQLRAPKQRMVEELRGVLAQINELVAQAKQLMPEPDLPPVAEERGPVQRAAKAAKAAPALTAKKQPKAKAAKTTPKAQALPEEHVDKLERELQDIEKKLKSL